MPGYRDDTTGAYLEPADLTDDEWRALVRSTDELGRIVSEEYGVRLEFHPHADSHVETREQVDRFLADTDPRYVSLCLDTGHLAYRQADSASVIRDHPDRVGYVHIKQMDPALVARPRRTTSPSARRSHGGPAASRQPESRTSHQWSRR